MRNRIMGLIGVLWGGGVVLSSLLKGEDARGGAYATGSAGAAIFGLVMFCAGMFYLIKGDGNSAPTRRKKKRKKPKPTILEKDRDEDRPRKQRRDFEVVEDDEDEAPDRPRRRRPPRDDN